MSAITDNAAVTGILKPVFAKKIKDNRSLSTVLQNRHPLDAMEMYGDSYNIPILPTNSQSPVWDTAGGTTTFPAAAAVQTINAKVTGWEFTERFQIPFGTAAQLQKGKEASFATASALKALAANKAIQRSIEYFLVHGSEGFATVASVSNSSGVVTVTLTAGSYAPAFLAGFLNGYVDDYNGASKRNSGNLQCTAVDSVAGTITLTGANGDTSIVAAGDTLYRAGQKGLEGQGLYTQIADQSSTIYNVNRSTYNYMRGTVLSSTGNFSAQKLLDGIAQAADLGLEGNADFLCPNRVFAALAADLQSLRRLDVSYSEKKTELGTKEIEIVFGNIVCRCAVHPYMKTGVSMLYPTDAIVRPSATDVTDSIGGMDLQVMSSTTNSMELRLFSGQSFFLTSPAQAVVWTGITYSNT